MYLAACSQNALSLEMAPIGSAWAYASAKPPSPASSGHFGFKNSKLIDRMNKSLVAAMVAPQSEERANLIESHRAPLVSGGPVPRDLEPFQLSVEGLVVLHPEEPGCMNLDPLSLFHRSPQ